MARPASAAGCQCAIVPPPTHTNTAPGAGRDSTRITSRRSAAQPRSLATSNQIIMINVGEDRCPTHTRKPALRRASNSLKDSNYVLKDDFMHAHWHSQCSAHFHGIRSAVRFGARKAAGTGPLRLFPLTVAGARRCRLWHSQHAALGPVAVRVGSLHAAIRQQQPTLPWSAPSESVTRRLASYWRLDNLAAPATTASAVSVHGRPVVLYESSRSAAQRGSAPHLCCG